MIKDFLKLDEDNDNETSTPEIISEDYTGGRIDGENYTNLGNDVINEFGDKPKTPIGIPVYIYKFRKVSGITPFTTKGQEELEDVDVNEAFQFINIYNGNEPLTVVWEDSTKLEVNSNDQIVKHLKVGTYYKAYLQRNNVDNEIQNDNVTIFNIEYKTEFARKSLVMECYDWEPNMQDQMMFFYIIIDPRVELPQILELKSYVNEYNHMTEKFIYSTLNFENVNFKYAATGRNILETIQFKSIGEDYAYPKEVHNTNGEVDVILDENKIYKNQGINNIQFDFINNVALSDIEIIGRSKNIINKIDDKTYKMQVFKPSRLLLYQTLTPKPNLFTFNTANGNNVFSNLMQFDKAGTWNSYKDAWTNNNALGNYNILETKEVRAGLKFNQAVQNINAENTLMENISYIQTQDFFNDSELTQNLTTVAYCKNTVSKKGDNKKTLSEWLNINSFYNSNIEALSYSYREIVKYSLPKTHSILGGIFSFFTGGLDWGWTKTNQIKSLFKKVNLSFPLITYLDFQSIVGVDSTDKKLLFADFFDDNKANNMIPVNTTILNSYRFSLTNYFQDSTNVKSDKVLGEGKDGVWSTIYLGQTKYEDGAPINTDSSPLNLDLSTFKPMSSLNSSEFIIDRISFRAIGSTEFKISAFDYSEKEIYGFYGKTVSKIKNDLRLWKNEMKFNYYDKYNTIGQVKWPQVVKPITPSDITETLVSVLTKPVILINEDRLKIYNETLKEGEEEGLDKKQQLKIIGNTPDGVEAIINYVVKTKKQPTPNLKVQVQYIDAILILMNTATNKQLSPDFDHLFKSTDTFKSFDQTFNNAKFVNITNIHFIFSENTVNINIEDLPINATKTGSIISDEIKFNLNEEENYGGKTQAFLDLRKGGKVDKIWPLQINSQTLHLTTVVEHTFSITRTATNTYKIVITTSIRKEFNFIKGENNPYEYKNISKYVDQPDEQWVYSSSFVMLENNVLKYAEEKQKWFFNLEQIYFQNKKN